MSPNEYERHLSLIGSGLMLACHHIERLHIAMDKSFDMKTIEKLHRTARLCVKYLEDLDKPF